MQCKSPSVLSDVIEFHGEISLLSRVISLNAILLLIITSFDSSAIFFMCFDTLWRTFSITKLYTA